MILLSQYRRHIWVILLTLCGLIAGLFSFNYLIANESSSEYSIVNGLITDNKLEIKNILYENSIYEENIHENVGVSSYYGRKFHKRKTASGERYNMHEFTAAHRSLPFGTILKVTNLDNNKTTLVRINDRGPFIRKRMLDLSFKSASVIDGLGLPNVKIEGFDRKNFEMPVILKDDFYFAYSFNHKPMLLPSNYFNIKFSTPDFNEAMNFYIDLIENGVADEELTFIVFDELTFSSFNPGNEFYHVAVWTPVLPRKIPVMTAEKVHLPE